MLCVSDICSDDTKDPKISLIIPCQVKHTAHLFDLLKIYEQQTVLPDEVIVSISEFTDKVSHVIQEIEQETWPFQVKLHVSENKYYAGKNRNIACGDATGDLIVCQDADDLPHPQRIEVIKYVFVHHHVDHIMHTCVWLDADELSSFTIYDDMDKLTLVRPKDYKSAWKLREVYNGKTIGIHNGNIAISKRVFETVKWPADRKGQDVRFNRTVYGNFKNRVVIKAPLVIYRNFLSSWR